MVYYHLTLSPWLRAWMWEIHYKDRASACAAWNHDPTRKVMNVHAKSGSCSLAPVTHAQKPVSGNQSSGMSIWLQPNLSQKGFLVKLFANEFSNQLSADQVDKWWLAGGCWSVSKTRKALLYTSDFDAVCYAMIYPMSHYYWYKRLCPHLSSFKGYTFWCVACRNHIIICPPGWRYHIHPLCIPPCSCCLNWWINQTRSISKQIILICVIIKIALINVMYMSLTYAWHMHIRSIDAHTYKNAMCTHTGGLL